MIDMNIQMMKKWALVFGAMSAAAALFSAGCGSHGQTGASSPTVGTPPQIQQTAAQNAQAQAAYLSNNPSPTAHQ